MKYGIIGILLLIIFYGCDNPKSYEILAIYPDGYVLIDEHTNIITDQYYTQIKEINNNNYLLVDSNVWMFNSNTRIKSKLPFRSYNTLDSIFPNLIILGRSEYAHIYDKDMNCRFKMRGNIYPFNYKYFYIERDNRIGIIDTNGKIILPILYSQINEFSDINRFIYYKFNYPFKKQLRYKNEDNNIFVLMQDSNYFLYDIKNNKKLSLDYERILEYPNDMLLVKKNNKYGFINKRGEIITKCIYDDVGEVSTYLKPYILMPPEFWRNSLVDLKDYLGCLNGFIKVKYKGKYGLINLKGDKIIPPDYQDIDLSKYKYISVKYNNKWKFVDIQTNKTVSPEFNKIADYNNNIAFVRTQNKWNLFDFKTKKIKPTLYDTTYNFHNEVAIAKKNELSILVDKNGNEVSKKYDNIENITSSLYICRSKNNFLLINNKGAEISDLYTSIHNVEKNGVNLFIINKNSCTGVIDTWGNILIPMLLNISDLEVCDNYVLASRKVVYNYKGEEIKKLKQYMDTVSQFNFYQDPKNKGLVLGSFWGIIDKFGKELIPVCYKGISYSNSFISAGKYNYTDIYNNNFKFLKRIILTPRNFKVKVINS